MQNTYNVLAAWGGESRDLCALVHTLFVVFSSLFFMFYFAHVFWLVTQLSFDYTEGSLGETNDAYSQ